MILVIAAALVAGSIMTATMAEAAKDKDDKNDNNPFKELWDAIAELQAQITSPTFVQDDLDEPVLELQVDPNSNAPALVVSDGTDDLFLVKEDGSIQIGSNTVVIRPDGTITAGGQPLVVQGSVGQTSFLQEWQTSDGTRVGTINPSGVLTANSFVGDGSGLTGLPGGADQSAEIAALQAQVAALELLTASMSADASNVIFTGVNLRIRDGTGTTACSGACNGLGNLIVGYDEPRFIDSDKSGSHNFVIGPNHNYPSFGGSVAGFQNTVSGDHSSVSGGTNNDASGLLSSVSGGNLNVASGDRSSVLGGTSNTASGDFSSVSGGQFNTASGAASSVSGGDSHTASGTFDWRAGSLFQDMDFEIPDFIKQPLYAFFNL